MIQHFGRVSASARDSKGVNMLAGVNYISLPERNFEERKIDRYSSQLKNLQISVKVIFGFQVLVFQVSPQTCLCGLLLKKNKKHDLPHTVCINGFVITLCLKHFVQANTFCSHIQLSLIAALSMAFLSNILCARYPAIQGQDTNTGAKTHSWV